MKQAKTSKPEQAAYGQRPALTPEAREGQMIALAMDLVEKRMREGTATSQETTHFLKLATDKAKQESEVLRLQAELLRAKTELISAQSETGKKYDQVLKALSEYRGKDEEEFPIDY